MASEATPAFSPVAVVETSRLEAQQDTELSPLRCLVTHQSGHLSRCADLPPANCSQWGRGQKSPERAEGPGTDSASFSLKQGSSFSVFLRNLAPAPGMLSIYLPLGFARGILWSQPSPSPPAPITCPLALLPLTLQQHPAAHGLYPSPETLGGHGTSQGTLLSQVRTFQKLLGKGSSFRVLSYERH